MTETAFPRRDVLFLLSLDNAWDSADPPEVERDREWLIELNQSIGEFAADASYVSFTDPNLPGWRSAYHGPNLVRLTETKRRHDPDRVFDFPQTI